ncbi:hypothetical protein HAX54_020059 [Datura stramonium]|uniref:Uncharacterized protein n=1 Tax=Datura stramonium TaxID=4076 RepID=A0ABS8URX8_DATST|nr:hypothetical protein [Datura stramonium]
MRTIQSFLFSPGYEALVNMMEFDYQMRAVRERRKHEDSTKRQRKIKWLTSVLTDGELPWLRDDTTTITKRSLSLFAKFWWAMVRLRLVPTQVDNILTLDGAVLVASLMSRFQVLCPDNSSINSGESSEDLLEESALVATPVPIGEEVVSLVDSSAADADTTAVPSAASTATIPTAARAPALVPAFVFTGESLASLARRTKRNEKQIDLLAQKLKPFIAKSIAEVVASIHEAVHILYGQIDVLEEPHDKQKLFDLFEDSPSLNVGKRVRDDDSDDEGGLREQPRGKRRRYRKRSNVLELTIIWYERLENFRVGHLRVLGIVETTILRANYKL